ncbi:S66 peptidase family protein [Geosporobacter ferrireducens]|uniref:LD-carboxypeptidase n=1 Tax=Geosporobacter ferrireducens TaxID=1424294 RepID=A0A1D8GDQ9_9FIRM|nr:LD-carboxypeptidase [Geosporobacter ferrireducens]AOT69053.1 LD-carboxypeptidase [Geosporobacter ferrireducens]MTI56722.1 LD-carboxypeptidase [Geosporobacter ferrireducens]
MVRGKALKFGDTIGVVAPASPTPKERVKLAQEQLEVLGFKVKMGKSCYAARGYLSGSDKSRAEDLNQMFMDPAVDGIMCLRGGYGTPKILNLLDYNMIRNNPKVFIGYSDITTIHTAIQQKCELITFHGPMASSDLADGIDDFSKNSLLKAVMQPEPMGDIQNPHGEVVQCLKEGKAEGQLIGGNLALIAATMGTPYEINTKGKILFLEDIGEEPYRVDRMLTQLALAGKFEDAAGIILGDWNDCEPKNPLESLSLIEVFEEILLPYQKPTVLNFKIGHCTPKITVPIGVNALLDAGQRKLIITEAAVQ